MSEAHSREMGALRSELAAIGAAGSKAAWSRVRSGLGHHRRAGSCWHLALGSWHFSILLLTPALPSAPLPSTTITTITIATFTMISLAWHGFKGFANLPVATC